MFGNVYHLLSDLVKEIANMQRARHMLSPIPEPSNEEKNELTNGRTFFRPTRFIGLRKIEFVGCNVVTATPVPYDHDSKKKS